MAVPVTVIRAARLFDGLGEEAVTDASVVVRGSRIAAVGAGVRSPDGAAVVGLDGATVVDLDGATLLPGLIDTHVHLAFDSGPDPVATLATRDDGRVVEEMATAARTALAGGVTAMRDLGDRDYLSLGLRGRSDLPTLLTAGPPITTPGGHCHFLGGAVAPTESGVRAAVRAHAERGVDAIKIMASGGAMTPGSRQDLAQFPPDVLAAAVAEAHHLGLPVTAHAHAVDAIADAVRAGVDGIEHASFWTLNGVNARPKLIEAIAAAGIVVGATLGMRAIPGLVPPPEVVRRMPALQAMLRALHLAGASLVAGTDAGIAPIKPPDAVRYAPSALQQIGMTPAQALRTVTSHAATALGLADHKGRLAAGYDADILAVDGDPLLDPEALHRVRAVFCRGSLVTDRGGRP